MNKWIIGLGALVLLLGGVGQSRAGNLITNGGFETGDFTDWTVSPQPSFLVENSPHHYLIDYYSHSGNYYLNIGSYVFSPGAISQTVHDTAGNNYTFSMYLLSDGKTPNEFKVQWNGVAIYDEANTPSTLNNADYYIFLSFTVRGTGTDTASFSGGDNPGALGLDDVSLIDASNSSAIPEPSALTLLGIGLAGMAGFTMRRRKLVVT